MKRGNTFLAAAMFIAAAFAMLPGRADPPVQLDATSSHAGCDPVDNGTFGGHGYLYCGYHWQTVPVRFRVVKSSAPAGIGGNVFQRIARDAAAEWNRAWPHRTGGSCGPVLCDATSDATVANTIRFSPLGNGVVGQASVYSTGLTITHVEIVLNSDASWHNATGAEIVTGERGGVAASACMGPTCKPWFDVQDVLTHEFGHFLGLEDLGNQGACLSDLGESVDLSQTMYGCFWRGDTSKRTLSWGDIAGLRRLAEEY